MVLVKVRLVVLGESGDNFGPKRGAIWGDRRDDFGNHLQWKTCGSRFKKLAWVSGAYQKVVVYSYDVSLILSSFLTYPIPNQFGKPIMHTNSSNPIRLPS